jgi:hypothetical protein
MATSNQWWPSVATIELSSGGYITRNLDHPAYRNSVLMSEKSWMHRIPSAQHLFSKFRPLSIAWYKRRSDHWSGTQINARDRPLPYWEVAHRFPLFLCTTPYKTAKYE